VRFAKGDEPGLKRILISTVVPGKKGANAEEEPCVSMEHQARIWGRDRQNSERGIAPLKEGGEEVTHR